MQASCLVLVALLLTPPPEDLYRQKALDALRWIDSTAVRPARGIAWPISPDRGRDVSPALYHGTAGVVLFLLEAHRATGEKTHLEKARRGADSLLAAVAEAAKQTEFPCGLYNGLAGLGFTLEEVFKATRETRYRQGAMRVVRLLEKRARKVGAGVEWSTTTDIIRGGAGIGLFLIGAAHDLEHPPARALAVRAAHRLIELARPTSGGLEWRMRPDYPRVMPNFSHGTAGVCYFLATLYRETREKALLDAALKGAAHLRSLADTRHGGWRVHHHRPGGEDLFYLGWCHGPPGTARLFYRLYQATGDHAWMDLVKQSARAVLTSGIPARRTPGFWNNVGVCCGSAGVAEFFLALHRLTGEPRYLTFARRLTDDLLARATRTEHGLKWVHAEHRVRPRDVGAQTGYMQGAAGIGLWLLRLDAHLHGRPFRLRLPDSPF